jgi:hypothetical protein
VQACDRFRLAFCSRDEAEEAKDHLHPRNMPWMGDAREAVMASCRGVSRSCVCHPVAVIIVALSSDPMPQALSTLFDSFKMPQVTRAARSTDMQQQQQQQQQQ